MLLTGIYLLSKVQELGLQAAYTSDDGVYRYISNIERKLFEFWDKFDNREISAENLLRSCSHLNGPVRAH